MAKRGAALAFGGDGSGFGAPHSKRTRTTDRYVMEPAMISAQTLFSLYNTGYEPPRFSMGMHASGELDENMKNVTCYHVYGVDKARAEALLRNREPVNIAMHQMSGVGRPYNKDGLLSTFNNRQSGYSYFWEKSTKERLPGGIAVYCCTPMQVTPTYRREIHVMNAIGLAFDHRLQPDVQFFGDMTAGSTDRPIMHNWRKMETLWNYFSTMWDMVFQCAVDKGLKAVCVSRIGGGAFGGCLTEITLNAGTQLVHTGINRHYHNRLKEGRKFDNFYEFLYEETLTILSSHPRFENISVVHCSGDNQPPCAHVLCPATFGKHGWNHVPGCFSMIEDAIAAGSRCYKNLQLEEVLFCNAWDPHSIAGNGNASDNSLDGWYGRNSCIGLMCYPHTNPWIKYRQMDFTPEWIAGTAPLVPPRFDRLIEASSC